MSNSNVAVEGSVPEKTLDLLSTVLSKFIENQEYMSSSNSMMIATFAILLSILIFIVIAFYLNQYLQKSKLDSYAYWYRKGKKAVADNFDGHIKNIVKLQDKYELSDKQLIPEGTEIDENILKKMKSRTNSVRKTLHNNFYNIASAIEEQKITTSKEAIEKLKLSKFKQKRVDVILDTQVNLNISYRSIKIAINIFQEINSEMIQEIENLKGTDANNKSTNLLLKNAILVYELAGIIRDLLISFELKGKDKLISLYNEIMKELKENERDDVALYKSMNDGELSKKTKDSTIKALKRRISIRKLIEGQWGEFLGNIDKVEGNVDSLKKQIHTFDIIRKNAKNQLGLLQSVAATQVIQDNMDLFQELSGIEDIPLAPLTSKDVCHLLGIVDETDDINEIESKLDAKIVSTEESTNEALTKPSTGRAKGARR